MKFDFFLIDAFAEKPLTGNPCAVVLGADSLDASTMLAIAKEMNQSETAFLLKSNTAHLKARYFTPEREIPLAGHPTIATIHAAIEQGLIPRTQKSIQLELNDGPITVETVNQGGKTFIRMFQRKPVFGEIHDPHEVLPLFGLEPRDLKSGCVIQTVSTGTPQLMIPVGSLESLKKVDIKPLEYKTYRDRQDFFSPHLFCTEGISPDAQTFARHPGAPPDTSEDAFTGSATGGMAAYLWKYQLISKPVFIAEQGHWMGRPGRAWVEVAGPSQAIESVSVAGTAVTVIKGSLELAI